MVGPVGVEYLDLRFRRVAPDLGEIRLKEGDVGEVHRESRPFAVGGESVLPEGGKSVNDGDVRRDAGLHLKG